MDSVFEREIFKEKLNSGFQDGAFGHLNESSSVSQRGPMHLQNESWCVSQWRLFSLLHFR